jgi:hypothetical protein
MPDMTAATAPKSHGLGGPGRGVRGDRGGAASDRDWAELAVGLGGEERRDGGRLGGDRVQAALRAPGGEQPPVALVCLPGRRRE